MRSMPLFQILKCQLCWVPRGRQKGASVSTSPSWIIHAGCSYTHKYTLPFIHINTTHGVVHTCRNPCIHAHAIQPQTQGHFFTPKQALQGWALLNNNWKMMMVRIMVSYPGKTLLKRIKTLKCYIMAVLVPMVESKDLFTVFLSPILFF